MLVIHRYFPFSDYRAGGFCSLAVLIAFLLALLVVSSTHTMAQEKTNNLPIAFSGRIAGNETSTRFFLDFDKSVSVNTFYMDGPDRIIIDLDEAIFDIEKGEAFKPRGLVAHIQLGKIAKGRSRIVLTLSTPAEITQTTFGQLIDNDTYRLLLDMEVTDSERYAQLLKQQRATIGDTVSAAIRGDRLGTVPTVEGRFKIVIDPGHGGIDGGAVGVAGTLEKDLTLAFANLLSQRLPAAGPFDIILTRKDDTFVSLKQRVALTENEKADLFISIHADSLSQRSVRGSTIYTLSKKASDRLSAQLAKSENSVDLIAGLSAPQDVEAVSDILVDLTMRETKQFSHNFSRLLVDSLKGRILLIKKPASFRFFWSSEVSRNTGYFI